MTQSHSSSELHMKSYLNNKVQKIDKDSRGWLTEFRSKCWSKRSSMTNWKWCEICPLAQKLHLTHWGRVMHICVSNLIIIGSDNGLLPGRHQAIIWTNAGLLLIRTLGTNFSEILIKILTFSFKKRRLKVSSAKWRPFCRGLNVLNTLSHML